MNRPKSALAALLLSIVIVAPAAAQQAPLMPQPAVIEFCSGCFAYLEFSASLEPELYAMRGQETETPKSLPAEGEPRDRLKRMLTSGWKRARSRAELPQVRVHEAPPARCGGELRKVSAHCNPSTTRLGRGCHPCLKYVLLPMCPVWTAPAVQGEFDVSAMVGCGHVFGLLMQPLWLLAMM